MNGLMLRRLDRQTKVLKGARCVSQLAVYGACKCSSSAGEPCSCAKSAAASRKQVLQLKQEVCMCETGVSFDVFLHVLIVCVRVRSWSSRGRGRTRRT